ncbi:ABC transporter ATP-binding protein [Pelosinus sp. IPA-1]|uniref:ABC transporter ATP-binding protein n=1 Tax=Pelosinus sp. IPA-1 TaxID=3029569 RepID=UPI00243624A1|nr:ABC transporter ATP-binding protein [Pelosinus sp. IPA-1]GMA97642.1 ABC transporter ATP-binding protein [Pelosinus sp. IPA-1]
MLKITNLHTYYGNIHALKGISLEVNEGEIVTLIGSNGAGKTTTLKTIAGLLKPDEGNVQFLEQSVTGLKPDKIVERGLVLVPEGRQVFPFMSVVENLQMGAYSRRDKAEIEHNFARVYDLFPRLHERRRQQAGTLSGGEQQMLAIGRALMAEPKMILLDEPSLGLAPILVESIFKLICEINKQGTTILLIEQNARMALMVANRGYVMETGSIVQHDQAQNLLQSDVIRKAYLGEIY